ncbi:MAG: hypothetical protein BA861_11290 [Desulfobacterales bacterium S3730MH5]|nr:MAG: hypothetical protein BA861_11290 [Desulfobacterales bacterium S3730MH5]
MTLMNHLTTGTEIQHPQHWSHRRAGVLLHPTSLPGPGRCGVLGDDSRRFVDLIASAGFTVWQVLPIGPVDDSLSPYLLKSVWEPVPGDELLTTLQILFPVLPLFAEDLGTITPEVRALRDRFDLPGMLVLQFGFNGSPDNPYLPRNHKECAVVYTGTHDNDTTLGWYHALDEPTRNTVRSALGLAYDIPAALLRAAYASPARLAVLPMQDLLGLGSEARMNIPGTTAGNWRWRFDWSDIPADFAERYATLAATHHRL